jgi:hypothetical protein
VAAASFDPETGDQIFTIDDIPWLKEKSAKAIERISSIASRLAGITADAIEDAEKN